MCCPLLLRAILFNSSKEQANAIAEYKIQKNDIIPGIKDHPDAYDKMSVIMITLNPDVSSEDQFIGLLNCLFHENDIEVKKESLRTQFGFTINDELGKELGLMCNWSEVLIEQGIEQGIKKGIEQGRTEGENQFRELINILRKTGRYAELEAILAGDEQLKQQLYKELGM